MTSTQEMPSIPPTVKVRKRSVSSAIASFVPFHGPPYPLPLGILVPWLLKLGPRPPILDLSAERKGLTAIEPLPPEQKVGGSNPLGRTV